MTARLSRIITGVLGIVLCAAGALIWTGCDTAGANDALTISPSTATLSSGQSQEFTVNGGYQYTWSLSGTNSSATTGTLSSRTGNTVVYTAPTSDTGLSGSVTLHVTSTIEGSASGTSNSPAYSVSADAVITFK